MNKVLYVCLSAFLLYFSFGRVALPTVNSEWINKN